MLYRQIIDDALEDAVGQAGLSRASLERELNGAVVGKIANRQYLSARRQA
jgi:hypothetical protein